MRAIKCRMVGHDWKHLGERKPEGGWSYPTGDRYLCRWCNERTTGWAEPILYKAVWYAARSFGRSWWTATRMDWFKPSEVPWWCYLLAAIVEGPAFGLEQATGQLALRGWPSWMYRWMYRPHDWLMEREFYWWLESHITGWRVVPRRTMESWTGASPDPPMHPMNVKVRRDLYDPKNPPRVYWQVTGGQITTKGGIPIDTWGNALDDNDS